MFTKNVSRVLQDFVRTTQTVNMVDVALQEVMSLAGDLRVKNIWELAQERWVVFCMKEVLNDT